MVLGLADEEVILKTLDRGAQIHMAIIDSIKDHQIAILVEGSRPMFHIDAREFLRLKTFELIKETKSKHGSHFEISLLGKKCLYENHGVSNQNNI